MATDLSDARFKPLRHCQTTGQKQVNHFSRTCSQRRQLSAKLFALVKKMFLDRHWSPEQIANRLKLENYPIQPSYKTLYRAIYAGIVVI